MTGTIEQALGVRTLASWIADTLSAKRACDRDDNAEWSRRHAETLATLQRQFLPHGSGIDGTREPLDKDASRADRLVFNVDYHAMDENGMYCGWFRYIVVATPSFDGVDVSVRRGQRRSRAFYDDGAMDWIADCFRTALSAKVGHMPSGALVAIEH